MDIYFVIDPAIVDLIVLILQFIALIMFLQLIILVLTWIRTGRLSKELEIDSRKIEEEEK